MRRSTSSWNARATWRTIAFSHSRWARGSALQLKPPSCAAALQVPQGPSHLAFPPVGPAARVFPHLPASHSPSVSVQGPGGHSQYDLGP